jgi:hypothetical protein
MREALPVPTERITAVFLSNASTSRNKNPAVPGGPTNPHVAPRSVVRRIAPASLPTQATRSLTAERPRELAIEPVGVSCQL